MDSETKFTVPDIVCEGCAGSIKNGLGKIAGIKQVSVNVSEKTVFISHNQEISAEKLAEKLEDLGFSSELSC